jgi:hypothetical protein
MLSRLHPTVSKPFLVHLKVILYEQGIMFPIIAHPKVRLINNSWLIIVFSIVRIHPINDVDKDTYLVRMPVR